MTPVGGAIGSSTIFAISFGIAVGITKASGATGRIGCFVTRGTAATGISIGGGGGGGGGPIGDTNVIKSSRSGIDCGISNGMRTTARINKP
jgi:hypothetical protein